MTAPSWPARIDVPGTGKRGSGFLVTDRHVLTCAHVVRGQAEVAVTLRYAAGPVTATVLTAGPWWSPTADAADVAVLQLREPVDVEPARFAPHTAVELYPGQELGALGFPAGNGDKGINCKFTATPYNLIGTDIQLDPKDGGGVWLRPGFSGSAVIHGRNGRVLGMIRAAARGEERFGAMVPVAELARHCPQLDELIELGTLAPKAYTELRRALKSAHRQPYEVGRILASLRSKVPSMPTELSTLAGVVEALVVETMQESDEDMRHHLNGLIGQLDTEELHRWRTNYLSAGHAPPARVEPQYDGAIVIRLEPSADTGAEAYDLTVWTVVRPDGELTEPVVTKSGIAPHEWREPIEAAIYEALTKMPIMVDAVMVEFVLPRRFLGEPVDDWTDRKDDRTRLGVAKRVVVRDLDWFNDPHSAGLARRANALHAQAVSLGDVLRWRDCSRLPGDPDAFRAWLRIGEGPLALVLAGDWTATEHVSTAVAAGPPVMLWQRWPCSVGDHGTHSDQCPGGSFRREVAKQLRGITIDTVAEKVRDMRARAQAAEDEDEMHCGSNITLLRDDGRRHLPPLSFAE